MIDALQCLTVLSEIVQNGCASASEIDGDLSCYFCGCDFEGTNEKHERGCAFVEARRIIST